MNDEVAAALERWALNTNAEVAPFGNPHKGLACDEAGYEMLASFDCCYRVYDEDGNPDNDHALMHPCPTNDSCRRWERICKEAEADRATLRAALEAAPEEHDPWDKAHNHNWLFCPHPTCAMVRDYENKLEAAPDPEEVALLRAEHEASVEMRAFVDRGYGWTRLDIDRYKAAHDNAERLREEGL